MDVQLSIAIWNILQSCVKHIQKTSKSNKGFDMVVADSSANVGNNRETTSLYLEYSSDHDNLAGENFRLVSITKNQF